MNRTLVGLGLLLLTQLLWVPPTNFGGLDEWLIVELTSRGVVSVPYAYRPLGLVWAVPAALLVPIFGFVVFRVCFAIYALVSAALVYALARNLLPQQALLALLTASIMVVWAPGDMARLSTVEGTVYQGITLGALIAVSLLVAAWQRHSVSLLAAAVLVAFLDVRCYEGCLPFLAGAPALLLLREPRARRLWHWAMVWWFVIALALAFSLLEVSVSIRQNAYQLSVLGVHPDPAGWLARMARQYGFHLRPLFASASTELLTPAVPVAVVAFVLGLVFHGSSPGEPSERRLLATLSGLGFAFAGLGYSLVLLGVTAPSAFRLEFLSGPGIALFLAALVQLGASFCHGRAQKVVAASLGAWIVAVGTGRTLAMQRDWQSLSYEPRQMRVLSELVRAVPDVAPSTLLVFLDDGRAWRTAFSFHHAVQYLYERRAAGYVPGRADTLYAVAPALDGVRFEPWPIVRKAWDAPRAVYGYEQLVIVRHTRDGAVMTLDSWPKELTPLPDGARYEPRSRIRSGTLPRSKVLAH